MERKSIWKNFLILAVSGLIVLHANMAGATEISGADPQDEGCVLTDED